MSDVIVVGILSLVGTLAGAYLANRKSSALIAYRLQELEKKVDKHNTVIERTYELEKRADVFENRMKVQEHRMEDLEHENAHEILRLRHRRHHALHGGGAGADGV